MFVNFLKERKCEDVIKKIKKIKGCSIEDGCQPANKTHMQERAGDNRICNSCWSSCCHSNFGDCCFQAKTPRALGCNNERNGIPIRVDRKLAYLRHAVKLTLKGGQSTVEFAIVAIVLILIVIGLAAVLGRLTDGTFINHAIMAATNNITSSVSGAIDAFCF